MTKELKKTTFKANIWISWAIPLTIILIEKAFLNNSVWVERYYSLSIYPSISYIQRIVLGKIPFSVGDIVYAIIIVYFITKTVQFIIALFKKQINALYLKRIASIIIKTLFWIYISFNILWGFNYARLGIAAQLQLKNTSYTDTELKELLCDVIDDLNDTRIALGDSNYVYPTENEIFERAFSAYKNAKKPFPFLNYQYLSVKPSLLTTMVSYAGYSGYYNPFSGEAQVNTDLPKFYMPFVTCHEMAHQLGYASESEASFVGYLVAIHSSDTLFRYAALFELFLTANSELMQRDVFSAVLNLKSLNPLVKRDRRIFREFILGRQNNVEPIIKNVYDQYLKANQQKSGINSYNELVSWIVDYKRKHGTFY